MVKKNLVLLGMMAVGKTTLGRMIAKSQGLEFIDTDKHIEKKNLMSIKQIFEQKGEKFFRMEEKNEILKLLKRKNCVIALGGGAFMDKAIRYSVLKNSVSIWLDANINTLILQNIDLLPLNFQKKFLFFLESVTFFQDAKIKLDQKIISITEKNLLSGQ